MTVLFHGNFALNRARMAGITKSALANPKLKDSELAKPFGYGAPFARLYRSWLHKTGITKLGFPMQLTTLGHVVIENDPSLESLVSWWFLHNELVTDLERAEAWHFFALEFLPTYSKFTQQQLIEGLTEKLRPHSEMHFGPGSKLNQQIARKIIQVYTEKSGLGELGLIRQENGIFVRLDSDPMGPWKSAQDLQESYKMNE